ncbi:MAG TPA: serine/threonine-protein kinase, partial [Myxococcota bacterium]|nr:serine/threonine-protein kinase [Myxococcota bacterium]
MSLLIEELALPAPFGDYELLERIGTGGMAEIFRARKVGPSGFEKVMVIKRVLPELVQNRAFIDLLIAEARVTSLLNHPNIVQIHELGDVSGTYYIAMEFVDGSDLLNLLSRCTKERLRVPMEVGLHVVSEVSRGLAHAHAATDAQGRALNIIHRDVSPSNILISRYGDIKIMDFGVARADLGISVAREQERGVLKGKLGYMSPEQVTGRPIDRRSDIFALGVVLFECLTLKRLFVGQSDAQTLLNIRDADVEPRFKRHSYLPKPVRQILRKALAKDPADRYQTATDFQEAILDYLFDCRLKVTSRQVATFVEHVLNPAPSSALTPAPPLPQPTPEPVDSPPPLPPPTQTARSARPRQMRRGDLS